MLEIGKLEDRQDEYVLLIKKNNLVQNFILKPLLQASEWAYYTLRAASISTNHWGRQQIAGGRLIITC